MPRRFFRKFRLNREKLRKQWWIAPFDHLLHDPNLWAIRRRTVVPAFALGLFVAYLPFPGHVLTGIVLGVLLRINVPVSAITKPFLPSASVASNTMANPVAGQITLATST